MDNRKGSKDYVLLLVRDEAAQEMRKGPFWAGFKRAHASMVMG